MGGPHRRARRNRARSVAAADHLADAGRDRVAALRQREPATDVAARPRRRQPGRRHSRCTTSRTGFTPMPIKLALAEGRLTRHQTVRRRCRRGRLVHRRLPRRARLRDSPSSNATLPVSASRVQPMIDETKRIGTLTLDVALDRLQTDAAVADDLAYLSDCGAVAVTAESVGAAEAALAMTTAIREGAHSVRQSHRQISGRQAPARRDVRRYRVVQVAVVLRRRGPSTTRRDELPRAASLAKAYASDAFARMGIDGVQLHGAIGFTAEYDIQLYLKRSKWARPMFGDSDHHYERVAALGGL